MRGRTGHQIGNASKVPVVPGSGTLSMIGWVDGGFYDNGSGSQLNRPTRNFITKDGKSLYSVNAGSYAVNNGVTVFQRDTNNGQLTRVDAYAPISCGYGPQFLIESIDQAHIYVVAGSSGYIKGFDRNPNTSALTAFNTGTKPNAVMGSGNGDNRCGIMSPDGEHIYSSGRVDNTMYCLKRDNVSTNSTYGKLTNLTGQASFVIAGANQAYGLAMTSNASSGISGKFMYMGNFGTALIHGFIRDNNPASGTFGQLQANTAISTNGSIATSGAAPAWLAISPDDRHLYVACDGGTGNMDVFTIDQSTGALTKIQTLTGPHNGPWCVALTPDGNNLYIAESDGVLISQYTRDNNPASGTFGQLTAKVPNKVRACPYFTWLPSSSLGPNWVSISPDGKFLYANTSNGNYPISTFAIHQ